MSIRRILFSTLTSFLALAAFGWSARPTLAAGEPVKFDDAKRDLDVLGGQLKERKLGNEDLIGSLDALAKNFFALEGPGDPPADLPADANDDQKKAHALEVKAYEEKVKKNREAVRAYQENAIDLIFKALKVVVFNPKTKENTRNDVNLKGAQVLGDLMASADLAKCRDAKEVEKLREKVSAQVRDLLAGDLEEPKQEYLVPVAVLETAFAVLGKANDLKSLLWLLDNYAHTNNAQPKVERLKSAHKAMILFKDVKGSVRYSIVEKFVTLYTSAEASASNNASSGSTPQQKSAAAAAKKFWDDVKTDTIAVVNYYATPPGGAAPVNAEGQALTSMKELNEWWSKHNKQNRAPWLDEKVVEAPPK